MDLFGYSISPVCRLCSMAFGASKCSTIRLNGRHVAHQEFAELEQLEAYLLRIL